MAVCAEEKGILKGDEPALCIDVMVQHVLASGRELDFREMSGPLRHLRYELERKYFAHLPYDFNKRTFDSEKLKERLLNNPLVGQYLPQMSDPSEITYADFYAWVGDIISPFHSRPDRPKQEISAKYAQDVLTGFRAFYLILYANGHGVMNVCDYFDVYKPPIQECVSPEVAILDLVDEHDGKYDEKLKAVFEKINELVEFHKQRPAFSHGDFLGVIDYFLQEIYLHAVSEGIRVWSVLRPGH